MIKVIPFKPGHLDFMTLKECHKNEPVIENLNYLYGQSGVYIHTLIFNESPIAAIGLLHIKKGVVECFMGCSDKVKDCSVSFVKTIQDLHDRYVKELELHRLQIIIRSGHDDLIRWAEFLGFEQEGLMKKYGSQGDDYFMYARTYGT